MRMRQKKFKEEQIGDFGIEEKVDGRFRVYGPGSGLPVKTYKTLRAARLYAHREDNKLRENG